MASSRSAPTRKTAKGEYIETVSVEHNSLDADIECGSESLDASKFNLDGDAVSIQEYGFFDHRSNPQRAREAGLATGRALVSSVTTPTLNFELWRESTPEDAIPGNDKPNDCDGQASRSAQAGHLITTNSDFVSTIVEFRGNAEIQASESGCQGQNLSESHKSQEIHTSSSKLPPRADENSRKKSDYIVMDSGNKVSRRANIAGTPNITLGGKTVIMADVILRGDLTRTILPSTDSATAKKVSTTAISIGRCTIICTGTIVKPPAKIAKGEFSYYPMKIGDNVFVGPGSVIQSAMIGSHVHIGKRCILHPFSIIRDNVKILDDTIIAENFVVAPNSIVGGRPGRIVGEVGEGWGVSVGGGEGWVEGGDLRELIRSIK